MNHLLDYIYLAQYVAPMVSVLGCAVLLAFSLGIRYTHVETRIKTTVILYLCAACFSCSAIMLYVYFPAAFVPVQSLTGLSLLYEQVLFYRLFHILTAADGGKRFSPWHYLVPLGICAALTVWSLFVPFDVQLELVLGRGRIFVEGYGAYSRFFLSKLPLYFLWGAVYLTLTFIRLAGYYKRINAAHSLVRRPARWMLVLVSLVATSIVVQTMAFFVRSAGAYLSLFMLIFTFTGMAQVIVLTVTVLRRGFRLYITFPAEDDTPEPEAPPQPAAVEKKPRKPYSRDSGSVLTRAGFEAWFREHKPYLDPSLSLVGLAERMDVNRTYLSGFVNRTYGMNFNRYVNGCRLREVERLRSLAANREKPLRELVEKAGFGSVKYYNSVVAAEKGNKL